MDPPSGPHTWQGWRFTWQPDAHGSYELCCRARDAAGDQQPLAPFWTARGMGNNVVHRVPVLVV